MSKIRNRFTKSKRNGIDFTNAKALTKQSARDECDINLIMKKFVKTGIIEHGNAHSANYGDVPAIDFRSALELIQNSEDTFSELPAAVRRRFDNDPAQFLGFCEDPDNLDEAVLLGLADAPAAAPAPEPASDTPPPEPASSAPS